MVAVTLASASAVLFFASSASAIVHDVVVGRFANYVGLDDALAEGASSKVSASATAMTFANVVSTTAAYGTATIPPEPTVSVVTETITVQGSSWLTTYSSYPGSPAATPVSLQGTAHKIIVGGSNGQLTYSPSNITAEPRDTVVFEFHQKNHTATQAAFAAPCVPLANSTTGQVIAIDSGFMPVSDNATEFPTFNVTVNNTTPTWFYCKQHTPAGASHCGSGMVFAINAVADSPRNFTAFQQLAMQLNGTSATSTSATGSSATSTSTSGSGASPSSTTSGGGSSYASKGLLGLGSMAFIMISLL